MINNAVIVHILKCLSLSMATQYDIPKKDVIEFKQVLAWSMEHKDTHPVYIEGIGGLLCMGTISGFKMSPGYARDTDEINKIGSPDHFRISVLLLGFPEWINHVMYVSHEARDEEIDSDDEAPIV